jgi:quinol monooxygenase YgiN
MPALRELSGCIGLSMLTEPDSGRCIVATAWADAQAMKASDDDVRPVREKLAGLLGGEPVLEHWDVAVLHRERPAGDGARAQVTWARINPARMDNLLDAFRHNLVPRLQELPGFCSISMLVYRKSGRGVAVTSYEDRTSFEHTRKEARSLRDQFIRAVGATAVDLAEMDLALAHLHVPETA